MALDSDYATAQNVEFYINNRPGAANGKTYVTISTPGDVLTIIDRPMYDEDKARFARQWQAFQMKNNDMPIVGYMLEDWAKEAPESITEGQVKELQFIGFRVVEQLAAASDRHIAQIGLGAEGLRVRAQQAMKVRNASEHDREMAALKEQITALSAIVTMQAAQNAEPAKRGPGRPPKVEEAITA